MVVPTRFPSHSVSAANFITGPDVPRPVLALAPAGPVTPMASASDDGTPPIEDELPPDGAVTPAEDDEEAPPVGLLTLGAAYLWQRRWRVT